MSLEAGALSVEMRVIFFLDGYKKTII